MHVDVAGDQGRAGHVTGVVSSGRLDPPRQLAAVFQEPDLAPMPTARQPGRGSGGGVGGRGQIRFLVSSSRATREYG